jgi:hypothetical protein
MDKGESSLYKMFAVFVILIFIFLILDVSLSYFNVGGTLVPVINLLPSL